MIVDNQQNLKVHFAGLEAINHLMITNIAEVNYSLFSIYKFIHNKVEGKGSLKYDPIPSTIESLSRHTIMDSGLFTLMFGSQKGEKSVRFLDKWTDLILEFMQVTNYTGTYVEVDCQKVLGVEQAWRYREYMKQNSTNRQINVFHIEDGMKGLDRMIEYSEYIAISVPELRFQKKKDYTYRLASYIKSKKPSIDIHLLGCTELNLLKQCSFCSSSDSTSWMAPMRYGQFESLDSKHAIKQINSVKMANSYKPQIERFMEQYNISQLTNKSFEYYSLCIHQSKILKHKYSLYAGDQQ